MKHRFLKTAFTAFPLALIIILGVKMASLHYAASQLNFRLPEGKNVLAVGQSQGEDGIDERVLTNWSNQCRSAEMFWCMYTNLQHFLTENKVDTVVIPFFDFSGHEDATVNTQYLLYENARMAIADRQVLSDLWHTSWNSVVTFYVLNDLYTLTQQKNYVGGYENWHHHGLGLSMKHFQDYYDLHGMKKCPLVPPIDNYSLQTRYLPRLVDLCKAHGTQLVILNYPRYHYLDYVDLSDVWDYYHTALGDSATMADYQEFVFPDTSYYANIAHLNNIGADYFCNHIKHHGLTTQTSAEWYQMRKAQATKRPSGRQ